MKVRKLLAWVLSAAVSITSVMPAMPTEVMAKDINSGIIRVSTQSELFTELDKDSSQERTICFESKFAEEIYIPNANYEKITLNLDAKKATLYNEAAFDSIEVNELERVYESGYDNYYEINDKKLYFENTEDAEHTTIVSQKKGAKLDIVNNGDMEAVSVMDKNTVTLTGKGGCTDVYLFEKGSKYTSDTANYVYIYDKCKAMLTGKAGEKPISAGSKSIGSKIINKTEASAYVVNDDQGVTVINPKKSLTVKKEVLSATGGELPARPTYKVVKKYPDELNIKDQTEVVEECSWISGLKHADFVGKKFVGWYLDAAITHKTHKLSTVKKDLTLYAKYEDRTEGVDYMTVESVSANAVFTVNAPIHSYAAQVKNDIKFTNFDEPNSEEDFSVKKKGSYYEVAAVDGFVNGEIYQLELLDDTMSFVMNDAAGNPVGENIRTLNLMIEGSFLKEEHSSVELDKDVKHLSAASLSAEDAKSILSHTGLINVSLDDSKTAGLSKNYTGSFEASEKFAVGDVVMVTDSKTFTKGEGDLLDSDNVTYIKITSCKKNKNKYKYEYKNPEQHEVLFFPDVIPIDIDSNDGVTNYEVKDNKIIITKKAYESSLDDVISVEEGYTPDIDEGDYLMFYTGDSGKSEGSALGYGEVVSVKSDKKSTEVVYKDITENEMKKDNAFHEKTEFTDEMLKAYTDEDRVKEQFSQQLLESGFIETAAKEYAKAAVMSGEVKECIGEDVAFEDLEIAYSLNDGEYVDSPEALAASKPEIKSSVSTTLKHFKDGKGYRVELGLKYKFDIKKKDASDSDPRIKVTINAKLQAEVVFGLSADGSTIWKKKWIIPYIADYRIKASLDNGVYVGIDIDATATLNEGPAIEWPEEAKDIGDEETHKKIIDITKAIKKKLEEGGSGESKGEKPTTPEESLQNKYASFIESAADSWVDISDTEIFYMTTACDPFHITAASLAGNFVVQANFNASVGFNFEYEKRQKQNAEVYLMSKKINTSSVDTTPEQYELNAYAMGLIGIRAGVRLKAMFGLFSTKLTGVGFQLYVGAYAKAYGFLFYQLSHKLENNVWNDANYAAGSLYIEIGAFLELNFVAEVLNGALAYTPSIYSHEWPIKSFGDRYDIFGFNVDEKEKLEYDIAAGENTVTLPKETFDMVSMDMKTGESETKNYDSKDEAKFEIKISDPSRVSYDPKTNTITVTGDEEIDAEITFKWNAKPTLSFTTSEYSKTIKIKKAKAVADTVSGNAA